MHLFSIHLLLGFHISGRGGARQEGSVLCTGFRLPCCRQIIYESQPGFLAEVQIRILSSSLLIETPTSAHISVFAKESKEERSSMTQSPSISDVCYSRASSAYTIVYVTS